MHFAVLVLAVALTWVAWKRLGPAFGVYSVAVLAISLSAPADFVPLVSLPRFLLSDFPLLLALAGLLEPAPRAGSRAPALCRDGRGRGGGVFEGDLGRVSFSQRRVPRGMNRYSTCAPSSRRSDWPS